MKWDFISYRTKKLVGQGIYQTQQWGSQAGGLQQSGETATNARCFCTGSSRWSLKSNFSVDSHKNLKLGIEVDNE